MPFRQWPELKLKWWTQTLPQVEKKHALIHVNYVLVITLWLSDVIFLSVLFKFCLVISCFLKIIFFWNPIQNVLVIWVDPLDGRECDGYKDEIFDDVIHTGWYSRLETMLWKTFLNLQWWGIKYLAELIREQPQCMCSSLLFYPIPDGI